MYREREREREMYMSIYECMYVYIYIYIYIYITYVYTSRGGANGHFGPEVRPSEIQNLSTEIGHSSAALQRNSL